VTVTVAGVPVITSATSVAVNALGAPFTYKITASGAPTSFGAGNLPAWLNVDVNTGLISGTPTVEGTYAINPSGTNLSGTGTAKVVITVKKLNQTLTFPVIADQPYGAVFNTGASATSGLPVTYTSTGPVKISGNTVTITGLGPISIRAHQNGNASYNAAATILRSFTAVQAPQTLTFPAIATQVYGATFNTGASASSGLPVYYTTAGPVKITGNTVTITGVGTASIRVHQDGNANYLAAPTVLRSFTINPAPQTITFPAIGNQTSTSGPITLQATASSGLPVTYTTTGPVKVSGNILTILGPGSAAVGAHQAGNSNYAAAPEARQTFTVSP
jgi:hypothetical protein